MSEPVIHLTKKRTGNTASDPVTGDAVSMYKDHLSTLLALFVAVFFSALFVIQSSQTGVMAEKSHDPQILSASTGDISLSDATPATSSELTDVDVVLYKDPFENVQIQGSAAYVFDVESGRVLYEKNKDIVRALASITKIMTALVAVETIEDEQEVISISRADLAQEGFSGLVEDEKWHFKDLLDFTLMSSSNDGASAIAASAGEVLLRSSSSSTAYTPKDAFMEQMNKRAQEIGMTQTTFYNESGLDVNTEIGGGRGTAEDIAKLFAYVLKEKPDLLFSTRSARTSYLSLSDLEHSAENTNQTVEQVSGLIGSKTGYTDLAGGNLAIAFDSSIGSPVIVVVLGSSREARFSDVAILSQAAQEAVAQGIYK